MKCPDFKRIWALVQIMIMGILCSFSRTQWQFDLLPGWRRSRVPVLLTFLYTQWPLQLKSSLYIQMLYLLLELWPVGSLSYFMLTERCGHTHTYSLTHTHRVVINFDSIFQYRYFHNRSIQFLPLYVGLLVFIAIKYRVGALNTK